MYAKAQSENEYKPGQPDLYMTHWQTTLISMEDTCLFTDTHLETQQIQL